MKLKIEAEKRKRGRKPGVKIGPLKHGAFSLLATGNLPEHRRYLERYLTSMRKGLISDLGPTEADLSHAQLIMVSEAISKLGVLRCVQEFIREKGVFEGGKLQPILAQHYLSWANSLRADLALLGLKKVAVDKAIDLVKLYGDGPVVKEGEPEITQPDAAGESGGGKGDD